MKGRRAEGLVMLVFLLVLSVGCRGVRNEWVDEVWRRGAPGRVRRSLIGL
jgi:hypothetical protein